LKAIATPLVVLLFPALLLAQDAPATPVAPPPVQSAQADPDARVDPLQPDFNLTALPTTLRLPHGKWAFRLTHRFTRPLGEGNFGDLLADAFGFDGSAQIGLELRYGLTRGTQVGVHRTSDRTIQFFGQHNFLNERGGAPLGLDAVATIEGGNNLQEHYQSALGAVLSKNVKTYAALYLEPIVVLNTNPFDDGDSDTLMLGIGGRLRFRPSWYLVGEITPRLAGYDPGASQASIGVEGRAGGHLFQVNFSNAFGTTYGQIARGAFDNDHWYIGFNISRKFF
jgi:hypothetical protein